MHKDELWQEYAKNGELLKNGGRPAHLGNIVETKDVYYGAVGVYACRRSENRIEILFQKRSQTVDRFPGKWDISCAGHINYGEEPVEAAIRELKEEIGVVADKNQLQFVCSHRTDIGLYNFYIYDLSDQTIDFHFDDQEVEKVEWVSLENSDEFRKKFCKDPVAEDDLNFARILEFIKKYSSFSKG